tara:strand:+ start:1507 stop:1806 length:300 start_codon:yes stop_codon:yes gene_type:complete
MKVTSNEIKVTKKEYEFLSQIKESDFSGDGEGLCDYITSYEYNMKSVRGLIPSLIEKGIINYDEHCGMEDIDGKEMAWATINDKYYDYDNHQLINLEVA